MGAKPVQSWSVPLHTSAPQSNAAAQACAHVSFMSFGTSQVPPPVELDEVPVPVLVVEPVPVPVEDFDDELDVEEEVVVVEPPVPPEPPVPLESPQAAIPTPPTATVAKAIQRVLFMSTPEKKRGWPSTWQRW